MKPTLDYDAEILDNEDLFDHPFYRRFTLREAPEPLALDDTISKRYRFPTFYGNVTCGIGIFLCSYERAAAYVGRMLHPRIRPVRMPKGRAIVAFSCYEYKQVMGVPPYNEIAMTIPVLADSPVDLPVLPMLWGGYPGFGYFVFSMPVTSLENKIRGRKIWGLPKVVQEIDVRDEGDDCVTTAFEESGEPYLELRVPRTGKPTSFDVSSYLYSRLDDRILKSQTCFQGEFAVTKHMGQLFKSGNAPDRPYLTLHDQPSARVLRELEIEPHPFQFRYARPMQSCFDLADPGYRFPHPLQPLPDDAP